MVSTAREYFLQLARPQKYPRFAGLHGRLEVVIDNREHWDLIIDDGRIAAIESAPPLARSPDCVLEASESDFVEIVNGRRNLLTSVMRGRVNVAGDLALAQAFNSFVRARAPAVGVPA